MAVGETAPDGSTLQPGDWICSNPACGDLVFAKNQACRKCGNPKSGVLPTNYKEGDWHCPGCGDHQFGKNLFCKRCGQPRPRPQGGVGAGISGATEVVAMIPCEEGQVVQGQTAKSGDWVCPNPECGGLVFAKNHACKKCGTPKTGETPEGFKPGDWICPGCGDHQFGKNPLCKKCATPRPFMLNQPSGGGSAGGARPGDWQCPRCGDLQFASNTQCRLCGAPRTLAANLMGGMNPAMGMNMSALASMGMNVMAMAGMGNAKPGDWQCPQCGDHQFAKNTSCRKCGAAKPANAGMGMMASGSMADLNAKAGDWKCSACNDMNFSRNEVCRKCGAAKNQGTMVLDPGDWMCPGCGDHQFAKNETCRKCGSPKPADGGAGKGAGKTMMSMNNTQQMQVVSLAQQMALAMNMQNMKGLGKGCMGGMKGAAVGFKDGDWNCPACGDHQFAKNSVCRKCSQPRPVDNAAQGGQQWAQGGQQWAQGGQPWAKKVRLF